MSRNKHNSFFFRIIKVTVFSTCLPLNEDRGVSLKYVYRLCFISPLQLCSDNYSHTSNHLISTSTLVSIIKSPNSRGSLNFLQKIVTLPLKYLLRYKLKIVWCVGININAFVTQKVPNSSKILQICLIYLTTLFKTGFSDNKQYLNR